jgi:hypothetical protein
VDNGLPSLGWPGSPLPIFRDILGRHAGPDHPCQGVESAGNAAHPSPRGLRIRGVAALARGVKRRATRPLACGVLLAARAAPGLAADKRGKYAAAGPRGGLDGGAGSPPSRAARSPADSRAASDTPQARGRTSCSLEATKADVDRSRGSLIRRRIAHPRCRSSTKSESTSASILTKRDIW